MAEAQKIKLWIVFGGRSGEHEISLRSAASVISVLDPRRFEISVIGITKSGKFADPAELGKMLPGNLLERVHLLSALSPNNPGSVSREPGVHGGIVFPLLHGPYGEDGTIQGWLEIAGLPYVGCGVLASAVGMDKDFMKKLFLQAGLPVPPYRTLLAGETLQNLKAMKQSLSNELGYPMFSKPANLGSSVGIHKIHSEEEFEDAVRDSFQFDCKILVEKGIDARELECAILGNDRPQASVVGEVIPANEFYDYNAKYMSSESRLEIPARIDAEKSEEIRDLALRSFKAIDGSGLSRVDFFLERKTEKVWVNEINTMPGFTPISMYAKLWDASGIPFEELLRSLVRLGMERYHEKNGRRISDF
jgi:D-alanine-D-alanine ligase